VFRVPVLPCALYLQRAGLGAGGVPTLRASRAALGVVFSEAIRAEKSEDRMGPSRDYAQPRGRLRDWHPPHLGNPATTFPLSSRGGAETRFAHRRSLPASLSVSTIAG